MIETTNFFSEMMTRSGNPRSPYKAYYNWFKSTENKILIEKSADAETAFRRSGITFNVYSDAEQDERLIPFDIVPRVISGAEWKRVEAGITQRIRALNAFLYDIYHGQEILRAGKLPHAIIANNAAFLNEMLWVDPPGGIYTHVVGTDLIRTGSNEFYVLEDNVRTPSGVSYMLENRETMLHLFPELFSQIRVKRVSEYPNELRRSLTLCAPDPTRSQPTIAILTPGIMNAAYFEHAFLADQMGAELVEGSDIKIVDSKVQMRTTQGFKPIDVLYRRVDDEYLDPLNFYPNSLLGVPGLFDVYRAGGITLANAPGAGIADDKSVYSYVPDFIEFYLGEKPLLKNVPTWRCSETDSLSYVLENLSELVVKEVHGSGGYGMLIGPAASRREISSFKKKLSAHPANYIAQPTLALSTVPIFTKKGLAERHVDLRPFALVSPSGISITPGGLTRVAMKMGSLVVNSSQGGGTKDTWVLED